MTDSTSDSSSPLPNKLGYFSFVLSLIAFLIAIGSTLTTRHIESGKPSIAHHEPGDAKLENLVEKAEYGLSFFEQFIVYVVGGLVGGTVSLIGLVAGLFSLRHETKWPAVSAIILSLISQGLLFGWF